MFKTCNRCGKEKNKTEFSRRKTSNDNINILLKAIKYLEKAKHNTKINLLLLLSQL